MTAPKSMKILALEAENFKRLKAVAIKPNGNVIPITGKNGQGKTSVLDTISAALAGKAAIQKQPVRKGQKQAEITLDLGSLKVRRTFTVKDDGETTTNLTVIGADGGKFASPQNVLDALCGEFAFEPLAFARAKPEEQFLSIRKLCPGVDFEALDRLDNRDYDARTEKNRAAKQYRAQAQAIIVPESAPTMRIDEAKLLEQMQSAAAKNTAIADEERRRAHTREDIGRRRESAEADKVRAADLRKQADALEAGAAQKLAELEKQDAGLDALPPVEAKVDASGLSKQIQDAQATNKIVDLLERRAELIGNAEIAEFEAEELSKAMDDRKQQRLKAIAEAKIPVEGLGFGEKVVLLNGVPFNQASDAEQLRASIGIAAALNPTLRVIRVRDGSLLDEDSMKLLETFAAEHDLQIWVERVDSSGEVGVVIEDGMVKKQPAMEAAE